MCDVVVTCVMCAVCVTDMPGLGGVACIEGMYWNGMRCVEIDMPPSSGSGSGSGSDVGEWCICVYIRMCAVAEG